MSATTLAVEVKPIQQPKARPARNSDSYHFAEALPAEELALVKKVRTYMKTKVAPIIFKYWAEDWFPFELTSLLDFIGGLFLFRQERATVFTYFIKIRLSIKRSGKQLLRNFYATVPTLNRRSLISIGLFRESSTT